MRLLLYLGPGSLGAALVFAFTGNDAATKLAVGGWIVFSLVGIIAKPRNLPELVMTWGNAVLILLAFVWSIIAGRPG